MKSLLLLLILVISFGGVKAQTIVDADLEGRVQNYLANYNKEYQSLTTAANEALWNAAIRVGEDDSIKMSNVNKTAERLAAFTGSIENIETAKKFITRKENLTRLQYMQLKQILYAAADNPQTIQPVVERKIKLEADQNRNFFDFNFRIDGQPVPEKKIDSILASDNNLSRRQKAWESSKEVGIRLKKGLADLVELRNTTVQSLGYKNFFDYQVADYNMSSVEMVNLLKKINKELRPLYRELHTYMRYELAKKYHVKDVPDLIPAHWLSNRWGQDWSSIVELPGINLDSALRDKSGEWILRQGEDFFVSMGFPKLPQTFWERSELYPVPAQASYKKDVSTSSWHIDLDQDVRFLMCIEGNTKWYEFVNHELAHLYNFLFYSSPEMPVILRTATNRAFYETLGKLTEMVTEQAAFLENEKLVYRTDRKDEIKRLLKEALNYVVFIPFSAGTMSMFEYDMYVQLLPGNEYNKRWWELAAAYQGISPPALRGEQYCDAATKMHIHGSPAQYYDYALSSVLVFQLHDYVATNFLHQDPRNTNYFGNKQAGRFLEELMKVGRSRDWNEVLKENIGSELSAQAMLHYFSPLLDYLKKENRGRKCTLPALE